MIYLIRHADAVPDEEDPARPLSAKGRGQVDRVCAILRKERDFKPAEFWHSPLLRSLETAQLLAKGLGLAAPVVPRPGLTPDDDPGRTASALEAEGRDIAVVGHEPHLGKLATLMVHGPSCAGVIFPFSKAGVLSLSLVGKRWHSRWIVRAP